jgi:sugar/nucleoside kinase (ribokinase family)
MPARGESGRIDAAVLGELVIDLIPARGADGQHVYAANPGGAPGNVAAGLARLGLHSLMLSKVGPGAFGDLLLRTLAEAGVDTSGVARATTEPTALAMVTLDAQGEREFMLYREGCANANLAPSELPREMLRSCRLLHVGSLSLATPVSAAAQRTAIASLREHGGLISADVNLRPAIWRDLEAMRATGIEAARNADILKVSTEELAILTGLDDVRAGAAALWHPSLQVLAVTRGAAGAVLFTRDHRVEVPGHAIEVIDTVGCGDAFMAALLAELLRGGMPRSERHLMEIGRFACAAGGVMAGRSGAMAAMPLRADIERLLRGSGAVRPDGSDRPSRDRTGMPSAG